MSRDIERGEEPEAFRAEDWISAAETIARVRAATLSPFAHEAIAKRAHAGLLRARATLMIVGADTRHERCEVPADFWWACGKEALTQNWELGDFETWIGRETHVRAFGVSFDREGVEIIAGPNTGPDPNTQVTGPKETGGRPMSALWPDWVAELARLVHEEGLPEGSGTSGAEEIISRVADRLAARGLEAPARTTVQETARAVLRRLRAEN